MMCGPTNHLRFLRAERPFGPRLQKKKNIITLTKNSRIERRLAQNLLESYSEIEPPEPSPTPEDAKQSLEEDKRKSSTSEELEENKKMESKENLRPTTQKNSVNKDSGKRLLSNTSSSSNDKQKSRRKTSIVEHDDPLFGRDPNINSGSSLVDFSEFKIIADPCCYELNPKKNRQTFYLCLSKPILQVYISV